MHKLAVAACALACAGCTVTTGSNRGEELHQEFAAKAERMTCDLAASQADKAAGRTGVTASATVTYWLGLKAALKPQPIDPSEVAQQIDRLPMLGVDPELIQQGQLLVERMRAAGTAIRSLSGFAWLLPLPGTARAERLARDAVEQCRVIERLRPGLTARYGAEFPPLDLPPPE